MSIRLKSSGAYNEYEALGRCPSNQPMVKEGSEYRTHLGELYCPADVNGEHCNDAYASTGALSTHMKKTHGITITKDDDNKGNPSKDKIVAARAWYKDLMDGNVYVPRAKPAAKVPKFVVNTSETPSEEVQTPPSAKKTKEGKAKAATGASSTRKSARAAKTSRRSPKRVRFPRYVKDTKHGKKGDYNFTAAARIVKQHGGQIPCDPCQLVDRTDVNDCGWGDTCLSYLAYFLPETDEDDEDDEN